MGEKVYFVDRKKIEATLCFMEDCVELYKKTPSWKTPLYKFALERLCQVVIESIIDVGNAMIDGFIMRDPGSYADIIHVLQDEKVINEADANMIKDLISVRKKLVQHYVDLRHDEIVGKMDAAITAIETFPRQVRTYLEEELGPVSAFLADEQEET